MKNVLIADDDASFRFLLQVVLEEAGYAVVPCEDGAAAWERLQKGGVDIVVLDVNMPGLDGIDVCKRIRATAALKELPVILLTVRSLVEDQLKGYDRGADDYITKPFKTELLLARLKALERRALNPS